MAAAIWHSRLLARAEKTYFDRASHQQTDAAASSGSLQLDLSAQIALAFNANLGFFSQLAQLQGRYDRRYHRALDRLTSLQNTDPLNRTQFNPDFATLPPDKEIGNHRNESNFAGIAASARGK